MGLNNSPAVRLEIAPWCFAMAPTRQKVQVVFNGGERETKAGGPGGEWLSEG